MMCYPLVGGLQMIHRFLIYDRKFNCRVDRRYPLNQFAAYNQQQQQLQINKKESQMMKKIPSLNIGDENSEISLNSCEGGKQHMWNIVTIESDDSEAEESELNEELNRLRLAGEKGEIVEHSQQLILGMTHSLKNMFTKLAPSVPKPQDLNSTTIEGHSFTMKTSKYRLIYFESFTGWKLVLLTDCPQSQHHSTTISSSHASITLSNGISVNSETALKTFYTQILQKFVLTYPLGQIYASGDESVDNDMLKRAGFLYKMDEYINLIDKLF